MQRTITKQNANKEKDKWDTSRYVCIFQSYIYNYILCICFSAFKNKVKTSQQIRK